MFRKGLSLVQELNWAEALDAFSEAYRIYPSPVVLFNIGYCHRSLGQYVRSLERFREFLRLPLQGAAASRRAEAEGFVRELEGQVARLEIVLEPELRQGSELTVDGIARRLGPGGSLLLLVDPGRHSVQVRREGYAPRFEDRDVRPGSTLRLRPRLERLPARLVVASNVSGALVLLDGERKGLAPFDAEVPAGHYRMEVSAPGYVTHRSLLNLAAGGSARVTADLTRAPVPLLKRWWFWTAVGAVVAGVAVGTWAATRPGPATPPYDRGSLDWLVAPK